jgi:hypothetical protein
MDQKDFERAAKELMDHCWQTLVVKGADYAKNGDRLHNFKAAARRRGIHPVEALTGMKLKHEISIEDICRDVVGSAGVPASDKLLEKIGDDINYNILLYTLLVEMRYEAGVAMRHEKHLESLKEHINKKGLGPFAPSKDDIDPDENDRQS